jgi:hypothetical protein
MPCATKPELGEHGVALDGQVERLPRRLKAALGEELVDAADVHAGADLDRVDAAEVARRPRSALDQLGEGLLEGDPRRLEADRVDVGDVVANHVHSGLMVAQARDTGKECAHHRSMFS